MGSWRDEAPQQAYPCLLSFVDPQRQPTAMGSVTAILDEEGNVLERRSYDAFGEMTCMTPDGTPVAESPTGLDVGFQGQIRDEGNGLYQMGCRWYNPTIGRWCSSDPAGVASGPNEYAFTENCPVNSEDTTGLKTIRKSKLHEGRVTEYGTLSYDVITSDSCAQVDVGSFKYEHADKFAGKFLSAIGISFPLTKWIPLGPSISFYSISEPIIESIPISTVVASCGNCLFKMKRTYEVNVYFDEGYLNVSLGLSPVKAGGPSPGGLFANPSPSVSLLRGAPLVPRRVHSMQTTISVESDCKPRC
jgi:RHS repeat-associated protein